VGRDPGGGGGIRDRWSASFLPDCQRLPPYFMPAPMALPEKYRKAKNAASPRMKMTPSESPSDASTLCDITQVKLR